MYERLVRQDLPSRIEASAEEDLSIDAVGSRPRRLSSRIDIGDLYPDKVS